MVVLLILLSLFIGIIYWIRCKSAINPATMFSFLWAFIFWLYSLKILNYYDLNSITIIIYVVQMVAFAVGTELAYRIRITSGSRSSANSEKSLNRPILYILSAITILVLFINSIDVIRNLSAGMSLFDIAHEGDIIRENESLGLMVGLVYLVVQPVTALISPIVAAEMFNPNAKHKILLFAINVIIVALHTLQHGGRDMLIVFGISYLFSYIIHRKDNFSRVGKLSILAVIVIALCFGVWISASRGIDDLTQSLYYYFSGAVPHLQTCVGRISFNEMTFGLGLLFGILSPILMGLQGFGFISGYPDIINQVVSNINIPTQTNPIGNGVTINAHVGLSYYFYADGGILFVFFGCALLGYLACLAFQKSRENTTPLNVAVYLFMLCVILMSFIRFQFVSSKYALAILYICILMYTIKKENCK